MEMSSLGEDLRALRTTRKMTLEDLAQKLGRSVGWLSQIERDISTPRLSDLRQIADIFEVPRSIFFGSTDAPDAEKGRIVRSSARRIIGERDAGLVEALVSPDLTDDFEMIHSTFQPGSSRTNRISRPTQELAYMISGMLASVGGILLAARLGRGDIASGNNLLLDSVAAALIGFAVLGAARPNAFGTAAGALFVGILLQGLTMMNAPYYMQDFVKGAVLVAALVFTFYLSSRRGGRRTA